MFRFSCLFVSLLRCPYASPNVLFFCFLFVSFPLLPSYPLSSVPFPLSLCCPFLIARGHFVCLVCLATPHSYHHVLTYHLATYSITYWSLGPFVLLSFLSPFFLLALFPCVPPVLFLSRFAPSPRVFFALFRVFSAFYALLFLAPLFFRADLLLLTYLGYAPCCISTSCVVVLCMYGVWSSGGVLRGVLARASLRRTKGIQERVEFNTVIGI